MRYDWIMRVLPVSDSEIQIMPETETEQFVVNRFLANWNAGNGRLVLKGGIMGFNSQNNLVCQADAPVLTPFIMSKPKE